MNAWGPTRTEPTGAPSVLDRHSETVSTQAAYSCMGVDVASLRTGIDNLANPNRGPAGCNKKNMAIGI
jgi:hypothetical protein